MKNLRKVTVLMMAVCLLATLLVPVHAAKNVTVQEMAEILFDMKVLQGDGKSFALDSNLDRSQAAAFIVRIMGMEQFVLDEKEYYSNIGYPDVKSTEWYAPYIGYCSEEGLIEGIPGGNFGPKDNLTEKQFLKIALCALGYEYKKDFDWGNVYKFAYEAGLVSNPAYKHKTLDNTNYKRSMVVEILYNLLSMEYLDTGITLARNLVMTGVVPQQYALDKGLISDAVPTAIKNVTVVDDHTITVQFNEEVCPLDDASIAIYETGNSAGSLTASIQSQSEDQLVITTAIQAKERNYTIEIKDVLDLEGNVAAALTSTFKGFGVLEVVSDFFKISRIEPVSKNVVNVFFTQPVNMNAELPFYYDILQGSNTVVRGDFQKLSAKKLSMYENAISIFLKDYTLQDGATYTLKLYGTMPSVYGVKLGDGAGDSMDFVAKGIENEGFYVVNVMPLDNKTISVEFNKEVDADSAQQLSNYPSVAVSNGSQRSIVKAVLSGDGEYKNRIVLLKISGTLDSSYTYELTIRNVYDAFKQMQVPQDTKYPFPGYAVEKGDLEIINVTALDKGTLMVYFNRPLSPSTATTTGLYNIFGVTESGFLVTPVRVYFDPATNPCAVKLYITGDRIAAPNTYKLRVLNSMRDHLDDTSINHAEYTFDGSGDSNWKPVMYEARIISKDSILVRVSEEIINGGLNTSAYNYTLEYRDEDTDKTKQPTSVTYINATTLLVRFDSLDMNMEYTLRFNNKLTDYGNTENLASEELNKVTVMPGMY